jgi:hypothetical protein
MQPGVVSGAGWTALPNRDTPASFVSSLKGGLQSRLHQPILLGVPTAPNLQH